MGMGEKAGQVREGFLADLLLVDGDPVADVRLLQETDRLLAILKGGEFHKLDRATLERQRIRAAE
jgi:imidazolonepropionase-like amidohydrolase